MKERSLFKKVIKERYKERKECLTIRKKERSSFKKLIKERKKKTRNV